MSYAKLFSTITESSLWSGSKEARILFVSILARANAVGFIEAAVPGLARMANLTVPETEAALAELMAPDPYSKSTVAEGRRLAKVPGGWCLVTYETYRARRDEEERREYMREYMRDYRRKGKAGDCVYCGEPDQTGVDHIVATANGGDDSPENLVPCCPTCNESKKGYTLHQWLVAGNRVRSKATLEVALRNPIVAEVYARQADESVNNLLAGVNVSKLGKPMLAQADADADADADAQKKKIHARPAVAECEFFAEFWNAYGKKTGRTQALKAWAKLTEADRLDALDGVAVFVAAKPDPQFRPDPVRYLTHRRWEDEQAKAQPSQDGLCWDGPLPSPEEARRALGLSDG